MKVFSDLPLLPAIQKSLDTLGFTKPTEIQEKVIPLLVENPHQDIHAQAQTGTGKTLAFGIPLLQNIDPDKKAVQALIIAPTRELVLQTYEALKEVSRQTNIVIEPIFGGMPINRQIDAIKRGAQIIVGTPGRLNDHLKRKTLSLKAVKTLVLDEADIMLDMGFKEEIDSILDRIPTDRQIWLFSATVKPGIKKLVQSHMKNVLAIKAVAKGVVCSQVKQYYCIAPVSRRVGAIARFIEAAPNFYGIIFCQTKLLTSEIMEQLASRGFRANCLHGDMTQALRNQVIKGFKNKDFNILVATDVAARGIDVSDLTHVINFTIPLEHENYIHRIGRTGRAGKEGIAISFINASEAHRLRRLERAVNTKLQEIAVPPIETIINTKMGAVSDFIEQTKKPDDKLAPVYKPLKELIDSFTEEEIRHGFTVALAEKFFKDIIHEKLSRVSTGMVGAPQEICMEVGQDDGLDEEVVRSYLHGTCNLQPQEIHKARVLQRKTFISVPENRLHECLSAMRAKPIADLSYKVYFMEDTYKRGSDKPRRSSSGRGGFRRGDARKSDRRRSDDRPFRRGR